ncbi:hypothetical protein ALC53_00267 [Atta colombica]|uniref:Uncharacterized protein n=1 Tax=Atta colombica TaxID=520822 RepID=A0A195BYE7_9HYME|nr:hypothetical protein ALC53_00267 [Atta colombica]
MRMGQKKRARVVLATRKTILNGSTLLKNRLRKDSKVKIRREMLELISMRGVYFPQYVRPNARFSSYPPACNGWLLNIGGQDGLLVF